MTKSSPHAGRVVKVSPEEQIQSGWALFKMAEQYRSVAIKAAGNFLDPLHTFNQAEEWASTHDPICNLFGHAAELYLKAFLTANECNKTLSGGGLGHKLDKLLSEAERLGLSLPADSVESLKSLNIFFGSQPYRLRYPSLGKRKIFFPHDLLEMCDNLREKIYPAVNYKSRLIGQVVEER